MSERHIHVMFGSETGNAQDVAERLISDAKRRLFHTSIFAMDDYDISKFLVMRSPSIVIFVCSTTGQGEEPDNMKTFWKSLLRKSVQSDLFYNINCAVLGLGDSSYEKFNFAAKKLYRRLLQLNAKMILPLGLADDQHELGYDGIVEPWIANLWTAIMDKYPLQNGMNIIPDEERLPARFKIEWVSDIDVQQINERQMLEASNISSKSFWQSKLIKNERVTAKGHFQDTRLISFDISGLGMSYQPGDALNVMPQNLPSAIDTFLKEFGEHFNVDQHFKLVPTDSDTKLPSSPVLQFCKTLTVRHCITCLWDLQGCPRRSFFRLLSTFSDSELEKERLIEFSSAEGQEELYSYCNRPRRTLMEVIQDFKDTFKRVPLEYLFDLMPIIRPRPFSIASNHNFHQNVIQILVAVVEYSTRLVKPRQGLCSTWLSLRVPGDNALISIRKGMLDFPDPNSDIPVVMIGPGTGVAPFRNFITGRIIYDLGNVYLFFGCRSKAKDFYFQNEFESYEARNLLTMFTAFSRDQENKVYVQHRLCENGELMWSLIKGNVRFYIAGSAKDMPIAVKQAIKDIIMKHGSLTDQEAEEYLKRMERLGQMQLETWS